jgi:site-specific DNA recombinase
MAKSYDLFESSKTDERRGLLGFVFSNLQLEGATLRYSLRKPFEQFTKLPHNPEWRPLLATIKTHFRDRVTAVRQLAEEIQLGRSLLVKIL